MNKMYSNQINKIQLGSKSEQKKQNREVQRVVKGAAMVRDLGRKTANRMAAFSISRDKAQVPYLWFKTRNN